MSNKNKIINKVVNLAVHNKKKIIKKVVNLQINPNKI